MTRQELARVPIKNKAIREVALMEATAALRETPEVQDWEAQQRNLLMEGNETAPGYVKRVMKDNYGVEYLVAEIYK